MSLFISRDWWSVNCGNDESFSANSLVISNIDNSSEGFDKIITASLEGTLRIYTLHSSNEDNSLRQFQANDLLIEIDLKYPILQISCGQMLSGNKSVQLVVLHPLKISVYSLSTTQGVADHGAAFKLLLLYEHGLPKSAYNFTLGPFGKVKGKDFICVQSLDGTLTFFEQENYAFSRHLPDFLLPGPLHYLPINDSFILSSSSWSVQSYRYQVLAIAKNDPDSSTIGSRANMPSSSNTALDATSSTAENFSDAGVSRRKLAADWSVSIGEPCLDIQSQSLDFRTSLIIVLGERNLLVLRENGSVLWMKKLNFIPLCMHTYPSEKMDSIMILLASELQTLLVYSDYILMWSSRMPFSSIAIARANFRDVKGGLVYLSDSGMLAAAYLGTNPSINLVPLKSNQVESINFTESEKELSKLRRIINLYNTDGKVLESKLSPSQSYEISIKISRPQLSTVKESSMSNLSGEDLLPAASFAIELCNTSSSLLNNVRLSVQASDPFVFEPSLVVIGTLESSNGDPNKNVSCTIVSTLSSLILPSNLQTIVIVSYTNEHGSPRVLRDDFYLPLTLVSRTTQPSRELPISLTINLLPSLTSQLDLRKVFADLYASSPENMDTGNISMGFHVDPNSNIVIISFGRSASVSSCQLKIKGDSLHGVAFITVELIRRLNSMEISLEKEKLDRQSLPTKEYFSLLESRFSIRCRLVKLQEQLSNLSGQYRAVQKRLLIKYRDRNPSSLSNLDILMEDIFAKILMVTNDLIATQKEFQSLSNALSSATSLFHNLLAILGDLNQDNVRKMRSLWSNEVSSDLEEGWEERTEVALMSFFIDNRDRAADTRKTNGQLEMPSDCDNLKRLISSLIETTLNDSKLNESGSLPTNSCGRRFMKNLSVAKSEELIDEESVNLDE